MRVRVASDTLSLPDLTFDFRCYCCELTSFSFKAFNDITQLHPGNVSQQLEDVHWSKRFSDVIYDMEVTQIVEKLGQLPFQPPHNLSGHYLILSIPPPTQSTADHIAAGRQTKIQLFVSWDFFKKKRLHLIRAVDC